MEISNSRRTTAPADPPAAERPPEAILRAAAGILQEWELGASLDDLLDEQRGGLPPRTAAAASAVLFHYFRNKKRVDRLLGEVARKDTSMKLRSLATAAAAQLFFLRGVPGPVVVSTAVDEAKRIGGPGAGGFMNAVLRRSHALHQERPPDADPFPEELSGRWRKRMSAEEFNAAAALFAAPGGGLSARVAEGAPIPPGWSALPPFHFAPNLRFASRGPTAPASELEMDGLYIQDPAASAAPCLFTPMEGARILDACAAPGGKSLAMAELFPESAWIAACDRSRRRLGMLVQNAARFGLSGRIRPLAADLASPPFRPSSFDRILLDAPCSNTGVFRSRPDALWRYSSERVRELSDLQLRLLRSSARLLDAGGELVYSVCSVEPEEGRALVDRFLVKAGGKFRLSAEVALNASALHDGVYAAMLRRT